MAPLRPQRKLPKRTNKPARAAGGSAKDSFGGRSKLAVMEDQARGRLLSAAAKARREKARATTTAVSASLQQHPEQRNDTPSDVPPVADAEGDEPDIGVPSADHANAKKVTKGKKGKIFASQAEMLSIIDTINAVEESKIETKLEKRKVVHELVKQREEKERERVKEKRREVEAKKKEILDIKQKRKGKRQKAASKSEDNKPSAKRVRFSG
ncbi:hypothetical protein HDU83_008377 [Entophlyctis luteolus]|nr:hypothetical protein HDU83_008377 [Entophlyctis luteolus]